MVEVTTNTYKLVGNGDTRELVVAPAVYKIEAGGNPSGATTAELVSIQDAGEYYTSGNVEGALQEVGANLGALNQATIDIIADVSALDGRVTTAEGEIDALQTQVSAIVEPQSGQGIEVETDGTVNLGATTNTASNVLGTRYLRGNFALVLMSDDGTRQILLGAEDSVIELLGVVLAAETISSRNYYTQRQTLAISTGLIAWNIALGQSAVVTLTQSATLSNPTNLPAATATIYPDLEVIQNATGGWVLSFGSNFVLPSTYVAAPTTANSRTLYHFHQRSDGKLAVNYTHYTT